MEPAKHQGRKMVLPILEPPLSKKQLERGEREHYQWHIRKLLDTIFSEPTTLEDIGLKSTFVEQ
eukprot:2508117-Rhodomonas_salina.1